MGVPTGRLQFFVLEATDYLERLAVIFSRPESPESEEIVRLTRALRGTALMAGLPGFAQAAAGLEHLAKSLRDATANWTPALAETASAAVTTLRDLTGRATDWSDQESRTAADLARHLAAATSMPEPAPRDAEGPDDELKPSVRAFVGREGSVIGGTLEHAAQALELGQADAAAQAVLPRLQPLRGLAALPLLSPLPEFLDAIELTIRSVTADSVPPDGPQALRRAAVAVTRLAREIAESGQTGADAPEVVMGAVSLLESFGSDLDVVDIATLFRDGDASPVVQQGTVPESDPAHDPIIELVSLADRFRQAADQLTSPASTTGRTLHLYGLLVQLRPLMQAAPDERPYLAGLLGEMSVAIGQGRAQRDPSRFGALLREAADLFADAATSRNAVFLGDELDPVVGALRQCGCDPASASSQPAGYAPERPAATSPPEASDDVVPIETLVLDDALATGEPPAPVESPETEPVDIRSLAPAADPAGQWFEESFSTYHRLVHPDPASDPAPAVATAAVPGLPGAPALPADSEADVVPIESLLVRGRRALERADRVRRDLSAALGRGESVEDLRPLVSELIDLVPLALEE